ncbi:hypothetical protein OS493_006432 [Desmophyllum pertusum]|uniref:Death domain-containing protein n=1 Tax=Desmophyllum pertusum TaxID=174260 RepID=A0A9X0A5K5_9CNID|nr:hypothetical protein OS493_006432 [Desmophyllum pertusum]
MPDNSATLITKSIKFEDIKVDEEQEQPLIEHDMPDENQAIDECAARGLPSIAEEETKTLVLSNGVLESLQSTCDASNVVARLQDKLQLNQAALADPGPETTRMIRCIATIAKNENRLDVVQHLRQITPAGTTGPLLPGRLDVREIRQSQIRDLTISLCGGEDWKLVAEKLGLRPNEISFLDKRTKNPCMETLVHSRNQRFINVDTLYNVLVECGLPRLADLL